MRLVTRAEAKAAGLTRYFTGKPCKYGHVAERLISNFGCCRCETESRKTPTGRTQRNAQHKSWRTRKPEHRRRNRVDWYKKNKQSEIAKNVAAKRERRRIDINFRLAEYLRIRVRLAIRNNFHGSSAVRDLGCSIPEFKKYIESQFQPVMSWDNWRHDGWHLDHIRPLSSFVDISSDRSQFLAACHYTNYQPLWAADNLAKGSKW